MLWLFPPPDPLVPPLTFLFLRCLLPLVICLPPGDAPAGTAELASSVLMLTLSSPKPPTCSSPGPLGQGTPPTVLQGCHCLTKACVVVPVPSS